MNAEALEFDHVAMTGFAEEVIARSGQPLFSCYQCRRCAAGCPVYDEDCRVTPDQLVRMVLLGDRQNALSNPLIWKCVSCLTCGTRCPNNIRGGRIAETLKKMAAEAGIKPLRPKVAHFHTSFFNDSLRWGRINEMGMMSEYEVRAAVANLKQGKIKEILSDIKEVSTFSHAMIRHHRLHLSFTGTAAGRKELKRLYRKSKEK